MSVITVSGRGLARKQKTLFDDFSVPLPPEFDGSGGSTLRDLITRVVAYEVEAFKNRQEQRRLTRVLSPARIEQGVVKGKVDLGGNELKQEVEIGAAVATALQAFEDGLYLVVIDGTEHRDLEAQIYIQPDSRVTFIRLVFLAGA